MNVTGTFRRPGLRPGVTLLLALLALALPLSAWAAMDGDPPSMWPIWAAAGINLFLGALVSVLSFLARTLFTDLRTRLDQVETRLQHTRESMITRAEVESLRRELRDDFARFQAELKNDLRDVLAEARKP